MKIINKVLSALTASAMGLGMCTGSFGSLGAAEAAEMTAVELVNDMGLGWNLGNTFDAWGHGGVMETAWGNIATTQEIIDKVKDYGFNSVRIPITWYEFTDATTFDIDDAYLARIKEVIDYCYNNDMYVMINMHWDWVSQSGSNPKLWLNNGLDAQKQFETMWTEIATYFKDYDNHLVFEDMNEVWWNSNPYSATDYTILNTLNQAFVDAVRATGGNNADRLLVLSGANADIGMTCNTSYVLPDDDMIAVDVHYYTPAEFCVRKQSDTWGTNKTTWGTDAEYSDLANNFAKLQQSFTSKGIPVILGEYGVLTNEGKEDASIAKFLEAVAGTALATDGFASYLWDDSDSGGHMYLSRKNLAFHNEDFGKIYIDLSQNSYVPPTVDWVETTINQVNDSSGAPIQGVYTVDIGNATKFNVEYSGLDKTGAQLSISYWDNNANSGKGGWVQNAMVVSLSINDGKSEISYETEDGTMIYNYVQLPEGVSTTQVQLQITYAGNAADGWVDLTSDQYPVPVKAYIPGVVDEPVVETTTTTTTTSTTTTTTTTTVTTEVPPSEVYGDANDNGLVEVADAVFILQGLADPGNSDFALSEAGSINANCKNTESSGVDAEDALAIQQFKAGLVTSLPV